MPAFSRGIFLRPQYLRPATSSSFLPTSSVPAARSLSASQFFSRQPSVKPLRGHSNAKAPPKPIRLQPSKSTIPLYTPYTASRVAETLVTKPSPTLLYTAPGHSYFIFSAYTIGISTIAYTAYNLEQTVFHPPPDLAVWVTPSFAVICLFTACFGVWFLRAPRKLIKSISAVPTSITSTPSSPARRELRLHIELRKVLPFVGKTHTVLVADPAQCGLNAALNVPKERVEAHRRRLVEIDRAWAAKAKKKSILTLPFRQLSLASHKLFVSMARVWRRDGFLEFYVDKKEYKLDISGGWALEDGMVLDKLVKVKTQV